MFKNYLITVLFVISLSSYALEPSKMESEDFLELCQRQLLGNCWVKMSGKMNIRSTSGKRLKPMPLKFAAQLIPNKIVFKTTVNNNQSFKIESVFGEKHDTRVLEDKLGDDDGFSKVGIKPEDLSLSFMYWDYIKEYKKDSIGVLRIACRVILLGNPDGSQFAKVWLSEKHLGPLRVEWYDPQSLKNEKPLQVLTFEDFAEKNKVWVPLEVKITNSKGDLQIKFSDVDAEFSTNIPTDLYNTEN